jgi:hypothetical protein
MQFARSRLRLHRLELVSPALFAGRFHALCTSAALASHLRELVLCNFARLRSVLAHRIACFSVRDAESGPVN